jgi:hypothetical protein
MKSKKTAMILSWLFGWLGVDRFYLGYTGMGVLKLLTLGGLGILQIKDFIAISSGELGPADGSPYAEVIRAAEAAAAAEAEQRRLEAERVKKQARERALEKILEAHGSLSEYKEKNRELDRCLTKIAEASLTRNLYYTKHDSAILGGAVSAVAGTGARVAAALKNDLRNKAVDEHNSQVAGKEYQRQYSGNSNRDRFFYLEESIVELICEAGAAASDKGRSPLLDVSSLWGQDFLDACIKCKIIVRNSNENSVEYICASIIQEFRSRHETIEKLII